MQSDNFKTTGCYNMLCKGFVQTDKYYFGSRVEKTSTYDGKMVEMPISLFQVKFKLKIFRLFIQYEKNNNIHKCTMNISRIQQQKIGG